MIAQHTRTKFSKLDEVKLGTADCMKLKVALDAGHGVLPGILYTGAIANGLVEDELTLDFVKRIGHHLRAAGHDTVVTRADGRVVSLVERVRIARSARCDVFVSIHCNAGPTSAHGAEAFIAAGDQRSHALATRLVKALVRRGLRNRGVKTDSQSQHSRLAVLHGTYRYMPAVLLEVGFLTNKRDAEMLRDANWREETAKELAEAIIGA